MREIIGDSFAGGGGASTGIEMALGQSPDIAINSVCPPLAAALVKANFAVEEVAEPEVESDDALPLWREAAE